MSNDLDRRRGFPTRRAVPPLVAAAAAAGMGVTAMCSGDINIDVTGPLISIVPVVIGGGNPSIVFHGSATTMATITPPGGTELPTPIAGIDSIRWDTRAGGSHSIQASTDLADAIADAGYSGNSSCTVYHDGGTPGGCPRNIEFTLNYDGLGTNAFIYGYTDTVEFGSLDVEEQDFIWEVNGTAMANMRVGASGQIPLFYQWTTHAGRTATGGGGTGANGVFTAPNFSKRMVAYRDGGSQDCRFTLIGSALGVNPVRISWDGTYNSVACGGELAGSYYDFKVSRAYRWTTCLQSSSANNVADGQVVVWVTDLSRDSTTIVYNQTGINKGYKAINASVDIGAPTRTSAAWPGATPFYRQETEYTYDHLAWQHMQHSTCSAAAAAWPGV